MSDEVQVIDEEGNPAVDINGNIITRSSGLIHSFYFWMKNRLQYYERNYERLQDILGDIGGIREIVYLIATVIKCIIFIFHNLK